MKTNHNNFLNLAFNLAKINLGKTKSNPSVGCVVVKNGSVISSGYTSVGGRPHAEYNALNKKINFNGSDLYVTLEPCVHYGFTPPCTNIIKKNKIKRVYYSFNDVDKRTAKKSKKNLIKKNIVVIKKKNQKNNFFYQSYFINKNNLLPLIDAKIALSKDYFSINKKDEWITNNFSRDRAHLIRSNYDTIISTSKSINNDNSLLNCRLSGLNHNKPDLLIIDLNLKIKINLRLFNQLNKRKIVIITNIRKNKKIQYLKKRGVKFILVKSLKNKIDFITFFKKIKANGSSRILIESGLIFLKTLVKKKLISNIYFFKSSNYLGKNGSNNIAPNFIKNFKRLKKIKVNLNGDILYKIKMN